MGQRTPYFQQRLRQHYPPVWQVQAEAQLLSEKLRQLLSYYPQLRAYCHLDTLAMVEIHRSLLKLLQAGQP
jgi:hypothetical protein